MMQYDDGLHVADDVVVIETAIPFFYLWFSFQLHNTVSHLKVTTDLVELTGKSRRGRSILAATKSTTRHH
jgi:hypothetical protein